MPLSATDQQQVQDLIDAASPEQRREMKSEAEATLGQVNTLMGQKLLSRDENKAMEIAVEMLVRIDATEKGKGWFFRSKRRLQLVQMYLGS